ncbi:MAG: zinc-ribbon domain-containing protein [Christensenellales bacterium]|jgi:hypothetical protein
MHCSRCGQIMQDTQSYCHRCGYKLADSPFAVPKNPPAAYIPGGLYSPGSPYAIDAPHAAGRPPSKKMPPPPSHGKTGCWWVCASLRR